MNDCIFLRKTRGISYRFFTWYSLVYLLFYYSEKNGFFAILNPLLAGFLRFINNTNL